MARREFTRNQREAIVERAKNERGEICCEGCGLVLGGKAHEIDHRIPEALRPEADKKQPLTIADGQLLGKECCHRSEDGKTAKDVAQIAKAKRQNARHIGIKRPKQKIASRGFDRKERKPKPALPPRPLFERGELWGSGRSKGD